MLGRRIWGLGEDWGEGWDEGWGGGWGWGLKKGTLIFPKSVDLNKDFSEMSTFKP